MRLSSFSVSRRVLVPLVLGLAVLLAAGGYLLSLRGAGGAKNRAENYLEEQAKAAKNDAMQWTTVVQENAILRGKDKKGRSLWSLGADEIRAQNEADGQTPRRALATNARATLYNNGQPETTFRAAKIILIYAHGENGTRMTMQGGVTARSAAAWTGERGPVQIKAPRVEVNVKARRLYAPQGAQLAQGPQDKPALITVAAQTMKADVALKAVQLDGKVQGTTPQGRFTAASADWNWQNGRVAARGPVVLTHEEIVLTGTSLQADTRAGRGVLQGQITVKAPNGQATAAAADYDWKNDKLTARGGVTLRSDELQVKAARVQLFDKMTRAVASGDNGVRLTRGAMTAAAERVEVFNIGQKGTLRLKASGGVRYANAPTTVRAAALEATGVGTGTGKTAAQKIVASDGAQLVSGDLKVSARRVEATSVSGKRVGAVTATGDVEYSRAGTKVSAGQVQALDITDSGAGKIIAKNGATLRKDDLTVTASRVEATNVTSAGAARVVASGGARARNADGAASGERVVWAGGEITASGAVKLEARGNTLRGRELKTDDKFRHATLSGDVSGRLADGSTVRAPQVSYDKKANRIVAEGGVSGRRDRLALRADRFVASADGKNAVLTGNVVVTGDDGATLRAPSMRYDAATRKIFASGGATFEHPQRELKLHGESVVYDLDKKEAVLKGGSGSGNTKIFENLKM